MSDDTTVGKGMGEKQERKITTSEKQIEIYTESFIRQITTNKNSSEQIAAIKYALKLIFRTLDIFSGKR